VHREAALDGTFRLAADAHITEVGYASKAVMAPNRDFRVTPNNGHHQVVGLVGPVSANNGSQFTGAPASVRLLSPLLRVLRSEAEIGAPDTAA
jgi:hypothetical protein